MRAAGHSAFVHVCLHPTRNTQQKYRQDRNNMEKTNSRSRSSRRGDNNGLNNLAVGDIVELKQPYFGRTVIIVNKVGDKWAVSFNHQLATANSRQLPPDTVMGEECFRKKVDREAFTPAPDGDNAAVAATKNSGNNDGKSDEKEVGDGKKNDDDEEEEEEGDDDGGEAVCIPLQCCSMVMLGETISGSKDKNVEHWVKKSNGGVVLVVDGTLTDVGKEFLAEQQCMKEDMGVEAWLESIGAEEGDLSGALGGKMMKDFHLFDLGRDELMGEKDFDMDGVMSDMVNLQIHENSLMCLPFANGGSVSSGGDGARCQHKLRENIPFFSEYYQLIESLMDIKATWVRASEKGTHSRHADSFTKGSTHRIILTLNVIGKKLYFGM